MTLKEVREASREARCLTPDWEWLYYPGDNYEETITQICRSCGDCYESFFADELDDVPQEGWEYDAG